MSHFWKLYAQEMRLMGTHYLMVLIAFFAMNGIIFGLYKKTDSEPVGILFIIILGLFYAAIPVLFAMSFQRESDYLHFSLPLRRSSILFARYGTALTLQAVTFLASTLWAILVMVSIAIHQMEQSCIRAGITDFSRMIPYYNDFWGFMLNESNYFFFGKVLSLCSFVILGIIAFTRSLRSMFQRFNEFLCDFSSLVIFIAFCWLGLRHLKPMTVGPDSLINGVIAGLVFLGIGLFLFEKYGEV